MTRRGAWRRACGVLLMVAAAGCGLPNDSAPSGIRASDVPFGLLSPSTAATHLPPFGPTAELYFVAKGRLVPRREHVTLGMSAPEAALRTLLAGPSAADVKQGLVSAIPAQTRLISLDVHATHAYVDLTAPFAAVGGSDQVLAVGQIVLTLTAAPQISDVTFAIDGHPADVPDGRGSQSDGPHRAKDYAPILR